MKIITPNQLMKNQIVSQFRSGFANLVGFLSDEQVTADLQPELTEIISFNTVTRNHRADFAAHLPLSYSSRRGPVSMLSMQFFEAFKAVAREILEIDEGLFGPCRKVDVVYHRDVFTGPEPRILVPDWHIDTPLCETRRYNISTACATIFREPLPTRPSLTIPQSTSQGWQEIQAADLAVILFNGKKTPHRSAVPDAQTKSRAMIALGCWPK